MISPSLEGLATAEAIRDRTREEQETRHDDGVSVDRPLQLGDARVQIASDRGQRDVDDGGVHRGEHERQTARDQNDQSSARRIACERALEWGSGRGCIDEHG